MKKDKKIQGFITANKPQISDNGQFMESLKRQMDLLPTPASLTEQENIDGQEWLAKLRAGMKASFRRDVAWVVGASLGVLCVAAVAYFLFFANTGITVNRPLSAEMTGVVGTVIHSGTGVSGSVISSSTELIETGSEVMTGDSSNAVSAMKNVSELGDNLMTPFKSFSHLPLFYIAFGLCLATAVILISIPVFASDDTF